MTTRRIRFLGLPLVLAAVLVSGCVEADGPVAPFETGATSLPTFTATSSDSTKVHTTSECAKEDEKCEKDSEGGPGNQTGGG